MVVSGANGFLGGYIVAALLGEGHSVAGIKRKGASTVYFDKILKNELGENYNSLIRNFTWKEADILDIITLDEILENEDVVFHCAARVAFNRKEKDEMMAINRDGTANVVNSCLKNNIKKLVHVSSTAALGRAENDKLISEEREWEDNDYNTNYAISKHLAELEVWRGIEEGLNAVIVNPGIILGAGDWQNGSCRLFRNVQRGFRFYTKGINGFVGVWDVAKVMMLLAKSNISAQRFLLIAENRSYQSLFYTIADAMQVARPSIELKKSWRKPLMFFTGILQFLNPASTVTPETVSTSMKTIEYDSARIKQVLRFEFMPIDECIARTCALYLKDQT